MTIHEKIAQNVRQAANQIWDMRMSAAMNESKIDPKKLDLIINDAVERIRTDILKEATAKLNDGKLRTSKEVIAKFVRLPTKTTVKLTEQIVSTKTVSDGMLTARIRQVIAGADVNGITVNSLLQRLSNHRDLIGADVSFQRVMGLVNKLSTDGIVRRNGTGRSALLFIKV